MGVEIKAPKGRPTALQIHNLKKIDEAGGFGILLYPKDFDMFKELVESIESGGDAPYKTLKERWLDG